MMNCHLKISVAGLCCALTVGAFSGCGPGTAATGASSGSFGQFVGDVVATWDQDGRNMTLREDFVYVDAKQRRWVAPAGSVVNGASIPSAFWTLIGGPFEGKYRNASVVHDVGCEEMSQSWEDVHWMFYEACRAGGVPEKTAKVLYFAVYHFGPRWETTTQTVVEPVQQTDGTFVEQEVTVQRVARVDPLPPTEDEMLQAESFVAADDPDIEQIRKFDRCNLCKHHINPNARDHVHADRSHARQPHAERAPAITPLPPVRGRGRGARGREGFAGRGQRADNTAGMNLAPLPPLSPAEEQWATQQVQNHIASRAATGPRAAQYKVERERGGYVVQVQFVDQNAQGEQTPVAGGVATARLSRRGQILDFVTGSY